MAGKFEGGQLVHAILTKVVFACQRLWWCCRLGLHDDLHLAVLLVLVWLHQNGNLCLMPRYSAAALAPLCTKEETRTLCALAPAWCRSSQLTSREPREVRLALIYLLLVSLPS